MAVRIAGVNLPDNKRIIIALTYVKGIGDTVSKRILAAVGIDENRRAQTLTEEEAAQIRQYIDDNKLVLEGDLRRLISGNIKRLREISAWRGLRHSRRLPARGQRTKTNSRTVRGNVRKTATSGKKPAAQKT